MNKIIELAVDMYGRALMLENAIRAAMDDSDEVDGRLLVKPFGYEQLQDVMRGEDAESIHGRLTGAETVGPVGATTETQAKGTD